MIKYKFTTLCESQIVYNIVINKTIKSILQCTRQSQISRSIEIPFSSHKTPNTVYMHFPCSKCSQRVHKHNKIWGVCIVVCEWTLVAWINFKEFQWVQHNNLDTEIYNNFWLYNISKNNFLLSKVFRNLVTLQSVTYGK